MNWGQASVPGNQSDPESWAWQHQDTRISLAFTRIYREIPWFRRRNWWKWIYVWRRLGIRISFNKEKTNNWCVQYSPVPALSLTCPQYLHLALLIAHFILERRSRIVLCYSVLHLVKLLFISLNRTAEVTSCQVVPSIPRVSDIMLDLMLIVYNPFYNCLRHLLEIDDFIISCLVVSFFFPLGLVPGCDGCKKVDTLWTKVGTLLNLTLLTIASPMTNPIDGITSNNHL